MTRLMKILEIESVIPNLIDCRTIEYFLTDFEFNREHGWPAHEHHVNASAHSRNVELEEDRSGKPGELRTKEFDLREPSVSLRGNQSKFAVKRELTQDGFGRCVEKLGN